MFFRRLAFHCSIALAPFALLAGCSSSHAGLPGIPATQNVSAVARRVRSIIVRPKDLTGCSRLTSRRAELDCRIADQYRGSRSGRVRCGQPAARTRLSRRNIAPTSRRIRPRTLASMPGLSSERSAERVRCDRRLELGGWKPDGRPIVVGTPAMIRRRSDLNTYRSAFGLPPCTRQRLSAGRSRAAKAADSERDVSQSKSNWGVEARLRRRDGFGALPQLQHHARRSGGQRSTNLVHAVQYAASTVRP